ncbi:exodeoxyribonuclease VII large subunit [Natronocella acetinitrilica]|uniref:Exodeoxyribonuclease 7 large subunit n=1 Tax=Natronocella acetinitrilica TaxID=414046 RepID=A0AAE3KC44_9GAMM|nr:exodeoxyribonuclease VII large subunit [Natronocella acetinitrilica]MCP1674508.1 exodeoxyribonuclease VII large subunit [Natronocella acetinitrilica]
MASPTYLNVPFAEKDAAKALGARFDGSRKSWFVPPEIDAAAFSRWLPGGSSAAAVAPSFARHDERPASDAPGADQEPAPGVSLSDLLDAVSGTVRAAHGAPVWVRAEVTAVSEARGGHTYLELVDYGADGREAAKARASVWRSRAGIISAFAKATGQAIAAGVKLLVHARVEIHPRFGLSLSIEDIDPRFTLGDMEAKLAAIRASLKAEGLLEANRSQVAPQDFLRVAVIAPGGAAGLGDFRTQADQLAAHGLCQFTYLDAQFQGDQASVSVSAALEQVRTALTTGRAKLDAVVLIRGGGDKAGLYALNDYAIARALCRMPVPVIVGIGHERDVTLLDELACVRLPTPSMVASHIAGCIIGNAREARQAALLLERLARGQVVAAQAAAEKAVTALRQTAVGHAHTARIVIDQSRSALREQALRHAAGAREAVNAEQAALRTLPAQLLERARADAKGHMQTLFAYNPHRILGQGYAIARGEDGRVVRSATAVRSDQPLALRVTDGVIHARVERIEPLEEECHHD